MANEGLTIQLIQDGLDVTAQPNAEVDADTVRVWADDMVVGEYTNDGSGHAEPWKFTHSDINSVTTQFEEVRYRTGERAIASLMSFYIAQYSN